VRTQQATQALERALAEVKSLNVQLRRTSKELRIQISERKQAQEALRANEQQQITQLAKANEALCGCLDSLAQSFAGISLQLFAAQEIIEPMGDDSLGCIERAYEIACSGLADARRSAHNLRSAFIEESKKLTL
jgi:phosphoglycerate-specific signal transduction histidine kinase